MSHLKLVLERSSAQQDALNRFEAEVLDPHSGNYRKWLTPEQFGRLYGPTDSDVAAMVAWLQSRGFTVEGVSASRTHIDFSGTVRQAEEAFHAELHSYQVNGRSFYAPATDLLIPSRFKDLIVGIAGLNTAAPEPAHTAGPRVAYDPGKRAWKALDRTVYAAGSGQPGSSDYLAITPADASTIYNAPNPILNLNYKSGAVYTGKGVTIGVVGNATVEQQAISNYRARFLGDAALPKLTTLDGGSSGGNSDEAYLALELVGALAPAASVHFYAASDVFSALEQAISDNSVDILNVGFSLCKDAYGPAELHLVQDLWMQAAAQGIAVSVAAERVGSAGCGEPGNAMVEGNALASSAFNIAVTATDTKGLRDKFSAYVKPSADASRFYGTALSYIPESSWRDSYTTTPRMHPGLADASSSPAGTNRRREEVNDCLDTACVGLMAKPVWQRGTGVPDGGVRGIPDVALVGGRGDNGSSWAVCTGSAGSGEKSVDADCSVQSGGEFYAHTFGGPSTAAAVFAGILALVQEKSGGRLGQAAQELYNLYNGPHASEIFHFVPAGDVSGTCTAGSADCRFEKRSMNAADPDGTRTGYTIDTGLGSVDAANLVKYWASAVGTGTATLTVTPSATTVSSVAGFIVDVTVAGTASLGTPTGTVVLQSGSFNSGTHTLAAGTFTFHIAPGALAVGSDTLAVSYSGDTNYAAATGSATVTVTQAAPTVTVTPSTHTMNSNAALSVVTTVSGSGGVVPTGTVTLTGGGYTSSAQTLASGSATFAIPAYSLSAGADVLTVNYAGDSLYSAASGSSTVNVTKSTFVLTATDLTVTAGATTNNASHVTVTPSGSYTGTVTLSAAVTSSPAGAQSAPALTGSTVTITSGPATGFITVGTTPAPAAHRDSISQLNHWFIGAGTTAFASLILIFLPGTTRRARAGLGCLFVLVSIGMVALGCGSDSKKMTTVTVTPAQTSIKATDPLSVAVAVAGSGSAQPTGTVTLTTGAFSISGNLSGGGATLSIPANTLASGKSNTLTVSYAGDNHYLAATGTATVNVLAPATTAGAYTVTVTGTGNDAGATVATATFTLTVK